MSNEKLLVEECVKAKLHKSVISIFYIENNKIKLLGSGIYIKCNDYFFVLTAAHVQKETLQVMYADEMDHISTIPYIFYKPHSQLDIAVYLLKNKLENFYEPIEYDFNLLPEDFHKYFLLGYPGTQAKFYDEKMHAALRTFISTEDPNPVKNVEQFELAIKFQRQKTYNDKGLKARFPLPYGMSGGPLFTFQVVDNRIEYNLFGLLTRYDDINDRTLIATRIEYLNEFMRRVFIDIENHKIK